VEFYKNEAHKYKIMHMELQELWDQADSTRKNWFELFELREKFANLKSEVYNHRKTVAILKTELLKCSYLKAHIKQKTAYEICPCIALHSLDQNHSNIEACGVCPCATIPGTSKPSCEGRDEADVAALQTE